MLPTAWNKTLPDMGLGQCQCNLQQGFLAELQRNLCPKSLHVNGIYLALLSVLNTRQAAVETAVHFCGAGQQCMRALFLLKTRYAAIVKLL